MVQPALTKLCLGLLSLTFGLFASVGPATAIDAAKIGHTGAGGAAQIHHYKFQPTFLDGTTVAETVLSVSNGLAYLQRRSADGCMVEEFVIRDSEMRPMPAPMMPGRELWIAEIDALRIECIDVHGTCQAMSFLGVQAKCQDFGPAKCRCGVKKGDMYAISSGGSCVRWTGGMVPAWSLDDSVRPENLQDVPPPPAP